MAATGGLLFNQWCLSFDRQAQAHECRALLALASCLIKCCPRVYPPDMDQ